MIRLGPRLAVSGGREAVIRLVVLAAAVGIGVGPHRVGASAMFATVQLRHPLVAPGAWTGWAGWENDQPGSG